MDAQRASGDSAERREESARHALQAFRERRRQRRAPDTYFGSDEALLPLGGDGLPEPELERRRCEIMEDAERSGMPMGLAELLYDVAREEGLDPSLGFELVRSGLGVRPPPEGLSNAPDAPVVDRYLPPWMFPAEPTDHLLRERLLRVSFRRLRSLLERHDDVEAALRAFAGEPDVTHCGY